MELPSYYQQSHPISKAEQLLFLGPEKKFNHHCDKIALCIYYWAGNFEQKINPQKQNNDEKINFFFNISAKFYGFSKIEINTEDGCSWCKKRHSRNLFPSFTEILFSLIWAIVEFLLFFILHWLWKFNSKVKKKWLKIIFEGIFR